jgi:hypothetical protein
MHFADVEVAYVTRRLGFGKEVKAVTRTSTFECYATIHFLVERFVDGAHTSAANGAHDSEATAERSSRRKLAFFRVGGIHRGLSVLN